MRGSGFAPPTPEAFRAAVLFPPSPVYSLYKRDSLSVGLYVVFLFLYYFDTLQEITHPYPSSGFILQPLITALPAILQRVSHAAKQFAIRVPIIVLHALNPFPAYPGTECFVLFTSCGTNAAPSVIVHCCCHIAVMFIVLYNLLLTIKGYTQPPSKFAPAAIQPRFKSPCYKFVC